MKTLIVLLLIGNIHWYNPQKGIGFIKWSQGMVFFHYSAVKGKVKTFKRGDLVHFTVNPKKRTVAKKVIKK
jgi:cold shock CspA family protein